MEEEIQKVIALQRSFINIDEEENSKIIDELICSPYVDDKQNLDRLLFVIQSSLLAKPQFHQRYVDFLIKLIPSIKKQYNIDELTTLQLRYLLFDNKYIATVMIQNGLFGIDEYRAKYPNKYADFNLIDTNQKENLLYTSIKNDDFNEFLSIISRINFDINRKLEYNEFDFFYKHANIPWDMAYIVEFAAYCGSINIFKYLYANKVKLDLKKLLYYAFSGGNYEIIHLIESNKFEYDKSQLANAAIEHHNNELIDYLINNYDISINNVSCIVCCIKSNNIEVLLQILDGKIDDDLVKCAVESSVRFGNLDTSKYLVEIKKVDLTNKIYYYGASLFKTAVRNYHIEMIKYIHEKIGKNINLYDDASEFFLFV